MCPQWFHSAFFCWQLLKPTKNNLLLRQLMWFKIWHSTAWSPNKVLDKLPPTQKYEIYWCIRFIMIDFLPSDISSRFKHTDLRYYSLFHQKTSSRSLTADWNQVTFKGCWVIILMKSVALMELHALTQSSSCRWIRLIDAVLFRCFWVRTNIISKVKLMYTNDLNLDRLFLLYVLIIKQKSELSGSESLSSVAMYYI